MVDLGGAGSLAHLLVDSASVNTPIDEDELCDAFEALANQLRTTYGADVGFVLMGVGPVATLEDEDGQFHQHQPFAFFTNAEKTHAIVALIARGLRHVAETEAKPLILRPGELN